MPSIAEYLQARDHPHCLLDRDVRLAHLPSWQRWDLLQPDVLFEDFDAIFCDPPFANVTIPELAQAISLLAAGSLGEPRLYIVHLLDREAELLKAFPAMDLCRHPGPLGYRTVKRSTQQRIHLYGPTSR